jgi:predicted HTH transcriptional regulator
VYSSLIDFLGEKGDLRVEPFDKSANRDATWEDISDEKIEWFLAISRRERSFPLPIDTNREKLFTHLNLLNRGKLSNAAVLLFGKAPQRFFLTSEVKCAHFHGTRVEKPIPFYQVYKGNLFELVDQAVNFVLSKIDYAVGERTHGATVSTAYEIPPEVIEEAVVNAVAHRDYDSTASVQVMLFADRLEISNPGQLPQQLPIENLKKDHASYPKNPLMAEVLYLAKYVERMGTGIQDMVKRSVDYGLAEPEFVMRDCFVTIIRRKKNIALKKIETGGQTGGQTLTDIQKQIADYMINNPMITRKELSANLKINASAVQKHIDKLKREGIIKREGADFGGKWVVERQESWCTEDCDEYNG